MAKGITGSGGVDTSALDGLISKLNSVLDTQQEINQIKIKPQADDSDIQKVKKSVEDLWSEARNTNRTKLELWDTKTVQKEIGNITAKLEELAKSFDISKESSESVSLTEKEFLRLYATLKQYSDKFGQEISSTYKNMFNSIFKNADVFKQDDLSAYFNKYLSSASDALNKSMNSITFEANETYVKNISEALKQEQAEAKRSAEAVAEAERKKRAEYIATRDAMVNDLKSAFNDIKSTAKDGQYLNIDEQSWGMLQQKFYDLTQLMSQMGFEVKEIEDSFGQLQNKVYVPTEQIDAARNSFKGIATEAEETVGEIDRMTSSLSNINNPEVDKLRSELESLRDLYHRACTDAWELEEANKQMYSPDEYTAVSGAASEYWMQLEKLKEEFTELQQKYNAIINTGSSGENALSKTFDINNVDKFVDILTQISTHLNDIKTTLGTVDDTNGFTNIINSVDILLEKLDEVRAKVGTGINNITINQGVDKTAQEQSAATSDYLRSTMSRYKNAYSKVTNAAGSEEKLFAYINTAINFKGGIDELYKTFSAASVSEIQTAEGQIYRLIDFFKVLREAMSSEDFGLNLSGIRLPSSDDTNFRSQLRKKSGVKKSNEEVLDLEDEKINLTEITDKLEEIRTILSEISQKDLFGDSLNRVSQKLDEIVRKFDSIVAKVEVINSEPILAENQNSEAQEDTNAEQTASEVQKATEAVREEGNAAEEAAKKKKEFADANKKVAESATNTAAATKEAVDGIKKEAAEAKEAAENQSKTKTNNKEDERNKDIKEYIELQNQLNKLQIENIKKSKNGVNESRDNEISQIKKAIKKYENFNFTKEEQDRINKELANSTRALADAQNAANKTSEKQVNAYKNNIDSAINSLNNLESKRKYIPEFSSQIDDLKNILNTIKTNSTDLDMVSEKDLQDLDDAINKLKELKSQATLAENRSANENSIQKNLGKINDVLSSNTKASFKSTSVYQDYIRLQEAFRNFDTSRPQSELNELVTELLRVDARFKDLDNAVKGGGFFTQFTHRLSDMNAKFIATYFSFQDIVRYARTAISTIQELNIQMVELAKVSDQSLGQIKDDFNSYADTAESLGASITDTISATADWARMGYNVPDSKELARVALLYKNVGDGIDISAANESLISTLQGYQMQADSAEHIVDVFNEVANNYAIDTGGIGEALQRSAASLNAANTSLEESVALVTAANTVVQNPESVGTTFKTLSARIRGATTELEELGEEEDEFTQTTSKLQGLVKSLTGFDILEDDQKTFKSIYDILVGIGKEWKNLDDIEQASLGEALAGKRNANVLYAVLDNIQTLESAYQTAEDSAGSAMREQQNYEQGIEYSVNRAKAALQELANDTISSDLLKGLIDTGTDGLNLFDKLIDKVGVFKTAIIGVSGVIGSQKLG